MHMEIEKIPRLIILPKIGDNDIGYLTVLEANKDIPFDIKRAYWTYHVPANTKRGMHAHKELHQLIIAIKGTIIFEIESSSGQQYSFELNEPNKALYIPNGYWRDIFFLNDAILVSFTSMHYIETDYIRDYQTFKSGNW